jgi:hypothetical protein
VTVQSGFSANGVLNDTVSQAVSELTVNPVPLTIVQDHPVTSSYLNETVPWIVLDTVGLGDPHCVVVGLAFSEAKQWGPHTVRVSPVNLLVHL